MKFHPLPPQRATELEAVVAELSAERIEIEDKLNNFLQMPPQPPAAEAPASSPHLGPETPVTPRGASLRGSMGDFGRTGSMKHLVSSRC